MLDQILDAQQAFALGRAQVSRRQNPAEPAVGGAVFRIGEHVRRSVVEGEPRAGSDARRPHRRRVLAREHMRAHDASQRVAIRDSDPCELKLGGARHHLFRMRGPAQERKIRHRRQLGKAGVKADHESRPSSGASRHLLPQAGEGFRPFSRIGRRKTPVSRRALRERAGVRARASARLTMAGRIEQELCSARFLVHA